METEESEGKAGKEDGDEKTGRIKKKRERTSCVS